MLKFKDFSFQNGTGKDFQGRKGEGEKDLF